MGWINSVPGSFGRGFVECLEQIVQDNGILLQEGFRKILANTASDWDSIVASLNGGNDRYYNLHRMGSKIEEIGERCRNPLNFKGEINENIDWEAILEDVKWVSKVVLHELQNNLVAVDPHAYSVEMVDYPHNNEWKKTREYRKYNFNQDE
jgi:hypothetical protein